MLFLRALISLHFVLGEVCNIGSSTLGCDQQDETSLLQVTRTVSRHSNEHSEDDAASKVLPNPADNSQRESTASASVSFASNEASQPMLQTMPQGAQMAPQPMLQTMPQAVQVPQAQAGPVPLSQVVPQPLPQAVPQPLQQAAPQRLQQAVPQPVALENENIEDEDVEAIEDDADQAGMTVDGSQDSLFPRYRRRGLYGDSYRSGYRSDYMRHYDRDYNEDIDRGIERDVDDIDDLSYDRALDGGYRRSRIGRRFRRARIARALNNQPIVETQNTEVVQAPMMPGPMMPLAAQAAMGGGMPIVPLAARAMEGAAMAGAGMPGAGMLGGLGAGMPGGVMGA